MVTLYKNFADNFQGMNENLCADDMVLTEAGRAYLTADNKPYFSNVHFQPVAENWMSHELIQMAFLKNKEHQGGVYAGTAGRQNLTYMAVSKASAVILYDINPYQSVFWKHFLHTLAQHNTADTFVDAMQDFSQNFYVLLRDQFNLAASQKDYPELHAASPDPKDHMISVEQQIAEADALDDLLGQPTDPPSLKEQARRAKFRPIEPDITRVLDKASPFKNESYKNFAAWFRIHAGRLDTEWLRGSANELEWLIEPELYTHLHLMAKHGAITPLTIDIACEASMKELAERLESARIRPITIREQTNPQISPPIRGAKIDTLYLSNIPHYLRWSAQEIKNYKTRSGIGPVDFAGRPVSIETWKNVCDNLRTLTADTARIIRFDKYLGRQSDIADFDCAFSGLTDDPEVMKIPGPLDPGGLIPDNP